MKKFIRICLFTLIFLLALPTPAFAQPELTSGCPIGYHLHNVLDQDDHTGYVHMHVGTTADQNGDGIICVKHTSTTVHVHIDNLIPVR